MRIHHVLMIGAAAFMAANSVAAAGIISQVHPAGGTGFAYKLQVLGGPAAIDLCNDPSSTRLVLSQLKESAPLFTTTGCRQMEDGEFEFTLTGQVSGADPAKLKAALVTTLSGLTNGFLRQEFKHFKRS